MKAEPGFTQRAQRTAENCHPTSVMTFSNGEGCDCSPDPLIQEDSPPLASDRALVDRLFSLP
jgi:hypothetical protein